jgi:hypothetical protein
MQERPSCSAQHQFQQKTIGVRSINTRTPLPVAKSSEVAVSVTQEMQANMVGIILSRINQIMTKARRLGYIIDYDGKCSRALITDLCHRT